MPKVSPIQSAFNQGEFSPLLYGRPDFDPYKNALKTSINGIGLIQGPWMRRPGTYFTAEVKDSTKLTRNIPFEFSTTQAYIIEAGDFYFRFYMNNGRIETSPGVAYEIPTVYNEAQVRGLRYAQSVDVLYLTHIQARPRKLSRTGHTSWTLSTISFLDGPYMAVNSGDTTLGLSGTTGSVTVTASSTIGINGGAGFSGNDEGRLIRWKDAANDWTWLEITGVSTVLEVTATIKGADASATTATTSWRLGLYSDTTGYPATVTFYEDRLFFGGCPAAPQRVDGSKTGDYENFAPTDHDGVVAADNALGATLNSKDVQLIRWMLPDEKALVVGTTRAEWVVRASTTGEALSATNITAKPSTRRGSADIAAIEAGDAMLFVQRAGRKVRELAYVYEADKFRSPDMTVLAEHITKGGIRDIAYQQEPQSIVWGVRADGMLLSFVYERDQKVLGWHRQPLGGDGAVESVACIPSADGTRDDLWMIVRRTIGGVTKRYVEYLTKLWERGDAQADGFYVDCGLTYSGAPATTVTGLSHLEGETVKVAADGATHPDRVVTGGQITLDRPASKVHVGYGYNSDGQMLRLEVGAADGTAQGKTQRTHRAIFRLHDTLGLKVGPSFDRLDVVPFRRSVDLTATAVPLFSGDVEVSWDGDYTTENLVCWRFDDPLPGTVEAIMPQLHTQDR